MLKYKWVIDMRKITHDEFLERVNQIHGNKIKVLGQYKNRRTKILVQCFCGYEWEADSYSLTKGHGCPKCANNIKRTTEDFKNIVKDLVGSEYEVLGTYVTKDNPIKMKHVSCGHEFLMTPNSFIRGQRCPKERYLRSGKSNTYSLEKCKTELQLATNDTYSLIGEYKGYSHKTSILHKVCGKIFEQAPTRIIKGGIGCPYCYVSKGENVIRDYLIKNGFRFKEQIRIKECRNIRPLPFDFGVYENNNLVFLIEYDGIQHFKPKFGKDQFEATQRNDRIKNEFCKSLNIPLIRIKYYRTDNLMILCREIQKGLESSLLNMTIPSEALRKLKERVTTR